MAKSLAKQHESCLMRRVELVREHTAALAAVDARLADLEKQMGEEVTQPFLTLPIEVDCIPRPVTEDDAPETSRSRPDPFAPPPQAEPHEHLDGQLEFYGRY